MSASRNNFIRRKNRVRTRIAKVSGRSRLSVFKSGRHIYAQVMDAVNGSIVVSASTLDKDIRKAKKSNCNVAMASKVGEIIAKKAADKGIKQVVFDKSGYKYHGVVKALADAARAGLEF